MWLVVEEKLFKQRGQQGMNRFAAFYELTLFEASSQEPGALGNRGWWSSRQQSKRVAYTFVRDMLLIMDVVILVSAGLICCTTHAPISTILSIELLYLEAAVLLLLARTRTHFFSVVGIYLLVWGIAIMLNLSFPGMWGRVYLYLLCTLVLYRFPWWWAFPFALLCLLTLLTTNHLPLSFVAGWTLECVLALACGLCWVGRVLRVQVLLVMTLQETHDLWKAQIIERERARIARDIHDVFAHSLSMLSIQVQAARNLRARDPERLAARLDDMAALIRESMTESRRIVGLLREPSLSPDQQDLGTHLRVIVTNFAERTGVHCQMEERGRSRQVSVSQGRTLELALREMLTNAYRHGAPERVWVSVQWHDESIVLETRDDGQGRGQSELAGYDEGYGHHGLRGMRERAEALGGEVEAGPAGNGGFLVRMTLPYPRSDR